MLGRYGELMAEIVLFHHAQGLTPGVRAFADELRAAGHNVHTPDLYGGKTFDTLEAGVAHAEQLTTEAVIAKGTDAVADLPDDLIYLGMSLGVMPAEKLALSRPKAKGLVALHSIADPAYFGPWPDGLRAQIHTKQADSWGDVEDAREIAERIDAVELFLYPGDTHLFTDNSLDAYDEDAAAQVKQRVLAFIEEVS